jgi:hypothetical protein
VKYTQVLKGKRAARRVRFPLISFRSEIRDTPPELAAQHEANVAEWKAAHPGEEPVLDPEVGLRWMTPGEEAQVLTGAYEFAVSRGLKEPKPGDDLYEYGRALHTVAIACVDVDTLNGPGDPEPFFDGGVPQILADKQIGKDVIIYLADEQQTWQEECATQAYKLSPEEQWAAVMLVESNPEGARAFLGQLQRPALCSLLLFTVSQLSTLATVRSLSGSEDETSTPISSSDPGDETSQTPDPNSAADDGGEA